MLKPYDKPEDIPEPFREHYSRREDGKYHADIPNDHPAVKHNATLLSEKQAAEEKARKAESDLESAKASGLSRGQEAVTKADADLVKAVKDAGIATVEAFTSMKDEHATLKPKVQEQERKERLNLVADHFKWNPEALYRVPGMPDIEWRDTTVDGQTVKVPHAKIKKGEEVTFEPLDKFFEGSADHKVFMPSLLPARQPDGTVLPSHGASGGGSAQKSIVDDFIKERDAAAASKPSPFNRKTANAA